MIQNENPIIANSLWSATANPTSDFLPLSDSIEADVAVIGAGFSGLSNALHLAQAGQRVVVLEAQTPGWGASGRNGGQVNPGLIQDPSHASSKFGSEMGRRMIKMSGDAGRLVFELIAKNEIQCDVRPVGWIRAAHNDAGLKGLLRIAKQWAAYGIEMEVLDKAKIADLLGTGAYIGGIIDPRGGNIHPLNYALGLAEAAHRAGAKIFGHSKAETLVSNADGHCITTSSGSVRTAKVVVCTNAYTGDLIPGLRQTVVPIRSIQVATVPMSDNLRSSVLPGLHAPSDTRRLLSYFRTDAHGRFLMGARGAYSEAATKVRLAEARKMTRDIFPQLNDMRWEYEWGGFVAATRDQYPHLNDLGNGIVAGLGYNGRGVAMATAMGKVLADWAIGVPAGELDFVVTPLRRIPFHGLHRLGVAATLARYKLMEKIAS